MDQLKLVSESWATDSFLALFQGGRHNIINDKSPFLFVYPLNKDFSGVPAIRITKTTNQNIILAKIRIFLLFSYDFVTFGKYKNVIQTLTRIFKKVKKRLNEDVNLERRPRQNLANQQMKNQ